MRRRYGALATIAGGAMALVALFSAPAAASSLIFCGGGRGPTSQTAIDSAVWDAQSSAQDMGFFGPCTFAEPPLVAQFVNDPLRGTFWRASVQLHCAE